MKRIFFYLMIVCLSLTIGTNELKASTNSSKTENSLNSFEAQKLVNRLHEIKSMDKTKMGRPEKKKLRTEVLSIAKRLKHPEPVIFISGGTLFLIILLLLILL
ncbi:MAG: hypothetical protein A3F72_18075 [Bacteroidetes bacterium RIFCSPLOWO2_12_FULL_35_15]|nr:MAG: hypothetical protein A3F72_18075 [Bacteroidetes bacterium RIFCSPLOWO2_12_FULL_35_15]